MRGLFEPQRVGRIECGSDDFGHGLYYADADYDIADRAVELAKRKGVRPIQIALAWVTGRPGVTAPIIDASRLEQLDQLVEGLSVELIDQDKMFLEERYVPHPVLGH